VPSRITRASLAASILLASVLLHLGLVGAILWAEQRGATTSDTESIEVELVKAPEVEPPKPEAAEPPKPETPEPPKIDPPKPAPEQPAQQQPVTPPPPQHQPQQQPAQTAHAPAQDQPQPAPEKKAAAMESGGPPSETKSKLTPEEIAALRAQVQRCWTLPLGLADAMKLEAVLRVRLSRDGAIEAGPDLLRATASSGGPVLVGIAMRALQQCGPYRVLPPSKYAEWRVLDLRFRATGMMGLGSAQPVR